MQIEIDEKLIPEGWEVDRFGIPENGDVVIRDKGQAWVMIYGSKVPELILCRKQPRRWEECEKHVAGAEAIFDAYSKVVGYMREIQPVIDGEFPEVDEPKRKVVKFTFQRRGLAKKGEWVMLNDGQPIEALWDWTSGAEFDIYTRTETEE